MSSRSYKRVIVILADGARPDVIDELMGRGDLPNISRCLVECGTHMRAVTSFPSTTGPAFLPFLTGCLPGTCNVPGIRWLDKTLFDSGGFSLRRFRSYVGLESFMMMNDVWPHIKTVFELVPGSYSIFNPIAKGAGRRNVTRISRIWYWYYGHQTDHWPSVDEAALEKVLATIRKKPRYIFANFPGIDTCSHLSHPHHEWVVKRYRWLDGAIGRIVGNLKERGEWETTALFIVSDHGLSKTDTHFCVNTFLEKRGLPPFFYPLIFSRRGKLSANMISGNGMTHLYFRNADGWSRHTVASELERVAPGLVDDLLCEAAIDIVACRDAGGAVRVKSRRGDARVSLRGGMLRYEVLSGDPFGYHDLPQEMDPRFCLEKTIDTEYPDALFQISHLMSAPRSGDVVLSATPGYDLRLKYEYPEHRASHGSLHASHMRVPIMSNVTLSARPARTVDVFPTVMNLLGEEIPKNIDGTALLRQ